ncbi:MmcQ/YjbR family DNA-binding protein [Marinobacterium arenosum]|uniref:MmcQ/YjbR family DNA-binding protein n=1 Tax=Marinobacterium arenosum TaxID=2862496 RepID=UPI001C97EE6C|nr:MmcQ/YjbR family DNA-binding protein [Marinobacterium arenosum]MBY4676004.1 MmcQ/YjbR family DNA-binding protein [Marinobacterium arenosum]
MELQQLREYLAQRPGVSSDYPFGAEVQVFRVKGKMFALVWVDERSLRVNLKCDPAEAQMLRDVFEAVLPGYHMNKRHWNTVLLDGSLPNGEVERMIDNSYALVVKGLRTAERQALQLLTAQQQDQQQTT